MFSYQKVTKENGKIFRVKRADFRLLSSRSVKIRKFSLLKSFPGREMSEAANDVNF